VGVCGRFLGIFPREIFYVFPSFIYIQYLCHYSPVNQMVTRLFLIHADGFPKISDVNKNVRFLITNTEQAAVSLFTFIQLLKQCTTKHHPWIGEKFS
jgi:hypothetical protein